MYFIKIKNFLYILCIVIINLYHVISSTETLSFVYNSIPYKVFDVTQIKGSSQNIKIAQSANVVVVAVGNAGVMIIDNQFNQYLFKSPDDSYIQSVQITSDAKYLLIAMKNKVGFFELINYKEQKNIYSIELNDVIVTDLQFNLNEDVLFILGQRGFLQWYDIRNKQNIKLIDQIVIDQLIFVKGILSPDEKFFYIAADFQGLVVFKINNMNKSNLNENLSIQMEMILMKQAISSFQDIVVTNKNEYIFVVDRWYGIFLLHKFTDLIIEGEDLLAKNDQIIKMEPAQLGNLGYTSTIELSANCQFLFVGIRSQGILIYNINDPFNPRFFQQLQLTGQSVSLRLSPQLKQGIEDNFDNQYIFYSNSLKIIVYQKQIPSLHRKTPNLFNMHQSKFLKVGIVGNKWRCNISPNNKYFYGAFDADSLIVLKLNLPEQQSPESVQMKLQYQFSEEKQIMERVDTFRKFEQGQSIPYGFYVDNVQFSKDGKYMYFPSPQYGMDIIAYKFEIIKSESDEYSFKYIKALIHNQILYCEQLNISEDEKHAIMSYDVGIVLVDMAKFEVLVQFNNVGVLGTCCGAIFSRDKKHALSVVRNVGLFIYNTQNMTNPILVNSWRTNGGETLLRSTTDDVIFLVDGFNGIILLDSTKFPEIHIISQFVPAGWSNFISFTINEEYIIISTMDTGMLTLLDIQDKYNPRLIMKTSIENFDSQTSCLDPTTMEFGFTANKFGVRYFTIQSFAFIHVERQVKEKQNVRIMTENETFEVGNQYIIRFVTLYRKQNQIITDIFYYKNLLLTSLPSWMQIDRENQTNGNLQTIIKATISKDCLESSESKVSFLIIVIKTCFQLSDKSFVFSTQTLSTTYDESLIIYKYLKSNGYINGINCVSDYFDPTLIEILPLDDAFHDQIQKEKQTVIEQYVTETLKKSTVYNQFIFDVKSSLKFNQQNQSQMVEAFQNYISVNLQFPQNSTFIFVQKLYPNLIIYFNDELTSMKMEGELQYINKVLLSKILFFDLKQKDNYIQPQTINNVINVLIMDNFNYDLMYSLTVPEQVFFLKEKSPIQLQNSLSEQLNKQYEDSQFYIEASFLIAFETQSFIDPDGIALTYELLIEISGEYVPLPNDSFIKFDNNNLRLVGTPPAKDIFTVQKLRLIAKNGYTTLKEDFSMKIRLMPFTYVFNLILQILGPIAFVFGIYKKRSIFMNIYFKKKTMYSTEIVYVNQLYRKKISILGFEYEIAHLLFQKFLKARNKLQLHTEYNKQSTENQQNQNDNNLDKLEKIKLDDSQLPIQKNDNFSNCTNSQVILNANRKLQEESQLEKIFKTTLKQQSVNEYPQSSSREMREAKNEAYLQDIKYFHNHRNLENNSTQRQQEKKNNQKNYQDLQNKQNEINAQDKKNYQFIKVLVVKNDGQIEVQQLLDLMLKYKFKISFNLQKLSIQNYKTEILNKKSRFYFCLKACIIHYLAVNDERTSNFQSFLKRYSLQQGMYLNNDWYKQYISVEPTNDIDVYGVPVPFSNTVLKEDSLFEIYKILEFIPQNLKKENFSYLSISQFKINPYLLREILFADALGLDQKNIQSIVKCSGESIHQEKHRIFSVEAYKLIEQGYFMCIRKFFNMNYQRLPISKYFSIPSWMAYDLKNEVLVLEGIPSKIDVNHILIRVLDESLFATYQFHLKIVDNPIQQDENKDNSIDNKDDKQNQQNDINSEVQLLQSSLLLSNRNRQSTLFAQSIFKKAQQIIDQNKEKDSINEQKETPNNQQINRNNQKDDIVDEEIETQKNTMDYAQSPPLFSHSPSYQRQKFSPRQDINNQILE